MSTYAQRIYDAIRDHLRPRGNSQGKITAQDLQQFGAAVALGVESLEGATGGGRIHFIKGEPPTELGRATDAAWSLDTGDIWQKDADGKWSAMTNVRQGAGAGEAATFDTDFVVSLTGGKTFGRYASGDQVQARGKSAAEIIQLAAIESIYPSYTPASVSLTQSAAPYGEVGESVTTTLTATFNRGDAGPVRALRLRQGSAPLGADEASASAQRTVNVTRSLAGETFRAQADYAAGSPKLVPPANTPDTRPPAVRDPNAPQATESGLDSNPVSVLGFYRIFYGAAASVPTDSAAVRALPGSRLSYEGDDFTLNTGNSLTTFCVVTPPGKTLARVVDLDAANADLTSGYASTALTVKDMAGRDVPGYRRWVLSTATPYSANHRHSISLTNG